MEPDVNTEPDVAPLLATLLQHRQRFLGYVTMQIGDPAAAEDILQSAYLRSLEGLKTLRDEDSVVGWFYQVLRHAIVDRQRRAGAEARALGQLPAEPSVMPELHMITCACVADVLAGLPPDYAAALRAVELEELPVASYARRADITPGNASVRLHRGRRLLAERLVKVCGSCAEHQCVDCSCHAPAKSPV